MKVLGVIINLFFINKNLTSDSLLKELKNKISSKKYHHLISIKEIKKLSTDNFIITLKIISKKRRCNLIKSILKKIEIRNGFYKEIIYENTQKGLRC